jgi:LysR family transcriptional regulator, hydrogen peroxide-inducible genes activator
MKLRPHAFTLRQLQYACAVAEHLSFRRAAQACRVAQPSLSAQIAELEGALEVQLFERDRRRVLVTSRGRALLDRARALLLQADDLVEAAQRFGDPFDGTLRIGVIPTIAPYLVPAATSGIRQRYPKLTIEWIEEKTEPLVAQLASGDVDGAVVALEAELGEIEHEVIASDPFVLVARPDDPLMQKDAPVSLKELRAASILLLDEGHCMRQQALEFCSSVRARELEFRATSLSTLVQLVVQGAGVTLLPSLALETEALRAELGIRQIAPPAPNRTIAMVWRKGSALASAVSAVAALIRENYPNVVMGRALPQKGQTTGAGRKRVSHGARDGVS